METYGKTVVLKITRSIIEILKEVKALSKRLDKRLKERKESKIISR